MSYLEAFILTILAEKGENEELSLYVVMRGNAEVEGGKRQLSIKTHNTYKEGGRHDLTNSTEVHL